jgi:hypothetical protein
VLRQRNLPALLRVGPRYHLWAHATQRRLAASVGGLFPNGLHAFLTM